MKLSSVILKNFRSYDEEIRVSFEDGITAFIGRNDIGKSTILEALEIFFNNDIVKIDQKDLCVYSKESEILIGCEFTDIPEEVLIDSTKKTNLKEEFLLNEQGNLEIHKIYDCNKKNPKEKVFAYCQYPFGENVEDLITLKISELKKIVKNIDIDTSEIDMRSSSEIRQAIWNYCEDLNFKMKRIPLDKQDAKSIWDVLKTQLPTYALFQSDRSSTDGDPEVQDPMKLAVKEALRKVEVDLESIKEIVKEEATKVADKTLEKLREMDEDLANQLIPNFQSEPNWDRIFKLTLEGDNQIPINKRGSGVRRLILLNFFRAQAEKIQEANNSPNIIYAIEEPETSQHPKNQRLLLEAFMDLADKENCQLILTTHVPELAGLLSVESLRYINDDKDKKRITMGEEEVYINISNELGILPDKRVKVLVCVEGPNDVNFIKNISKIIHKEDDSIPDIENDTRIAMLPLGGGNLKQWVYNHYLKDLGLPEIHIYDRDDNFQYQKVCDLVNERGDGSWGALTIKREMENYIHPNVINDFFEIDLTFDDDDDIPNLIKDHINSEEENKFYRISEKKVKKLLNKEVAATMSPELIDEIDKEKEIKQWLEVIKSKID